MNKDNLAGLCIGLFFGAAIGGAVALLYAPQEGAKTRQRIKDEASKVRDNASEFVKRVYPSRFKKEEVS